MKDVVQKLRDLAALARSNANDTMHEAHAAAHKACDILLDRWPEVHAQIADEVRAEVEEGLRERLAELEAKVAAARTGERPLRRTRKPRTDKAPTIEEIAVETAGRVARTVARDVTRDVLEGVLRFGRRR